MWLEIDLLQSMWSHTFTQSKHILTKQLKEKHIELILLKLAKSRALCAPLFALFIALTFEKYERYFFYKILVLIKSKNINVCWFF